jgi:tRNA G18 (ribose-2'-O)-methylase SpoU
MPSGHVSRCRTPRTTGPLAQGDTLKGRRPCIHWLDHGKEAWLAERRAAGWRLVAVKLADGATPLTRLTMARDRTILLLGHEHDGVPDHVLALTDECVEIPMTGWGASLNVAVAGSLVLYRLAGLS